MGFTRCRALGIGVIVWVVVLVVRRATVFRPGAIGGKTPSLPDYSRLSIVHQARTDASSSTLAAINPLGKRTDEQPPQPPAGKADNPPRTPDPPAAATSSAGAAAAPSDSAERAKEPAKPCPPTNPPPPPAAPAVPLAAQLRKGPPIAREYGHTAEAATRKGTLEPIFKILEDWDIAGVQSLENEISSKPAVKPPAPTGGTPKPDFDTCHRILWNVQNRVSLEGAQEYFADQYAQLGDPKYQERARRMHLAVHPPLGVQRAQKSRRPLIRRAGELWTWG